MDKPLAVLVVDDHEDSRELLRVILQGRGLSFVGAGDGFEGLLVAERSVPDLILLDLEMPRMDGFGLLTELKRRPNLRHVPVIILTATRLDAANVERGLALGADEYLTKPINPEELLVRIKSVVRARRAERQLQQLRADFSSMLVHDLRAPLEGVSLALSLLSSEDFTPGEGRELAIMARDQVRDLSEMIDGLMELYRVESEVALHRRTVDLAALLEEVLAEFALVARDKGLELRANSAGGPCEVSGDRVMLKRVLVNLLGNALKFTRAGGVTVRLGAERSWVLVEVEDTGPGVSPDELERLFDKYFHIQRRKDRPEPGFGLGLAFCKAAVEQHGGSVGVRSRLGEGATFWFHLPAVVPVAEPVKALFSEVPNG